MNTKPLQIIDLSMNFYKSSLPRITTQWRSYFFDYSEARKTFQVKIISFFPRTNTIVKSTKQMHNVLFMLYSNLSYIEPRVYKIKICEVSIFLKEVKKTNSFWVQTAIKSIKPWFKILKIMCINVQLGGKQT